ncbi:hypothetical protein [Cyclobacterium xiamenense]|uniref:hypothetical protein n=1 Tax=Cyclobacterium xiamenense TaxID=1297121 RepID=UPI0035D039BE
MTLIISWIGVDRKKDYKEISSIYIASDSRYSWGSAKKFDQGIKVFGSSKFPEIFGFCGDVLFPSIILGQIIPQIDNGILFGPNDGAGTKNQRVFNYIRSSLDTYPKEYLVNDGFTILHATRVNKEFNLFKTTFGKEKILKNKEIQLPKISTTIFTGGSGEKEFNSHWEEWNNPMHNNYGTSRAVYHCLSKTLKEIKDPRTGGLPQIVGLYKVGNMRLFGVVEYEKKYVYGKELTENIYSKSIEWRNGNFERTSPENLKRLKGAQQQPI